MHGVILSYDHYSPRILENKGQDTVQQNLMGSDLCVQKFITHLKIPYLEVYCYVVKCQNGKKIVSHEVSTI